MEFKLNLVLGAGRPVRTERGANFLNESNCLPTWADEPSALPACGRSQLEMEKLASFCDQAKASANIGFALINLSLRVHEAPEGVNAYETFSKAMDKDQPVIKVVDRRPFNPDGTPRELSAEEREAAEAADSSKAPAIEPAQPEAEPLKSSPPPETAARPERPARPTASAAPQGASSHPGRDPLDDPASFLSLIMSLASNAAASLGMMPHPVTGETGVDLKTAKHWIDVLGMLEEKTRGNLDQQEAQVLEGLLADLRMQYVSFSSAPTPPPAKFGASDITGGK